MLTRDVVALSATNALNMLGGFFSGIVIARLLGPEGRGDLAVILLWPGIAGHLATLGADVSLGRRTAQDHATLPQNLSLAVLLASAYGACLLLLALVILPFLFTAEKQLLVEIGRVALFAIPAIVLNNYVGAIALGAKLLWIFNIGRIALTAGYLAFVLLSWAAFGSSLAGIVFAYLASVWCGTLLTVALLSHQQGFSASMSGEALRQVAQSGIAFAPGTALLAVTNGLSTIWLAALSDARSVGLYVVALTFANAQQVVSHALSRSAFSSIANVRDKAKTSAIAAFKLRQAFLTLATLAAFVTITGPWLVPLMFGDQFVAASALLIFLVPGVACLAFGQTMEEMLKADGSAAPSVFARLASALCMSVCAALLIPTMGAPGMAIAFLIGGFTECLVFLTSVHKRFGLTILDLVVSGRHS